MACPQGNSCGGGREENISSRHTGQEFLYLSGMPIKDEEDVLQQMQVINKNERLSMQYESGGQEFILYLSNDTRSNFTTDEI